MRMTSRKCQNEKKIEAFLLKNQTGFLGLSSGNMPYILPLNFVWHEGVLYFHGANEGRKVDIIKENANATFVVSESYGTMVSPVPADTDTAYFSVMIFGKVEMVTDLAEATAAMQQLLEKYVPGYYEKSLSSNHVEKYRSSLGGKTTVFKLAPVEITAKENRMDTSQAFFLGRTIGMDINK